MVILGAREYLGEEGTEARCLQKILASMTQGGRAVCMVQPILAVEYYSSENAELLTSTKAMLQNPA